MLRGGIEIVPGEIRIDMLIDIEEHNGCQNPRGDIAVILHTEKQERDYIADIKEILDFAIEADKAGIDQNETIDDQDIGMARDCMVVQMVQPKYG
jgi:hypothetical protein